jgi:hypothetical protein
MSGRDLNAMALADLTKVDLRFVYRVDGLCQSRMGIDPIGSIPLGSKFPKMVHGAIRSRYAYAPNLALLHW